MGKGRGWVDWNSNLVKFSFYFSSSHTSQTTWYEFSEMPQWWWFSSFSLFQEEEEEGSGGRRCQISEISFLMIFRAFMLTENSHHFLLFLLIIFFSHFSFNYLSTLVTCFFSLNSRWRGVVPYRHTLWFLGSLFVAVIRQNLKTLFSFITATRLCDWKKVQINDADVKQ